MGKQHAGAIMKLEQVREYICHYGGCPSAGYVKERPAREQQPKCQDCGVEMQWTGTEFPAAAGEER